MRILYIADGRSPIAMNWIRYFIAAGHEVHLASSFPVQKEPGLESLSVIPIAFSEIKKEQSTRQGSDSRDQRLGRFVPLKLRTQLRQWLGPLTLSRGARKLGEVIRSVQPDLVHAMRIPYEGMVAAKALHHDHPPLLVSVWGNDFTLHATATPWMGRLTRQTLHSANALHTDCLRDQYLALSWGFGSDHPAIVLPGGGGVQMDVFYPGSLPAEGQTPLVFHPRGMRAYVRNDTIFQAMKCVLAQRPNVRFVCSSMAGQTEAMKLVSDLELGNSLELLPTKSRAEMAELFRQAQVVLSITTHDGTPNTLLEALASGCFPIAGDLESIREWITPGMNGMLVDAGDPQALAQAILQALDQPDLRLKARGINLKLVQERAEYQWVMGQADAFYSSIIKQNRNTTENPQHQ
jgi:glycosyltransferase involved in cell wall biosynthesis